jgi:hypothetical protein
MQRTVMFVLFGVALKAVTLGEEEWSRVFDRRVTGHWRKQRNVELWLFRAQQILFGWSSEGGRGGRGKGVLVGDLNRPLGGSRGKLEDNIEAELTEIE